MLGSFRSPGTHCVDQSGPLASVSGGSSETPPSESSKCRLSSRHFLIHLWRNNDSHSLPLFPLIVPCKFFVPSPHVPQVGLLLRLFRQGHFRTSWFLCLLTGELAEDKHWLVHGYSPHSQLATALLTCSPGANGAGPSSSPPKLSYVRRAVSGCRVVRITCGTLPTFSFLTDL